MADVNRGNRPLSPFMIGPYYRPQWTSMSSIFVRITGIGLLFGAILVVWWLIAAATSEGAFAFIDGLLRGFLGDIILFFGTWALFYHMLGRLRHVIWDFGYMLEVDKSELFAQMMVVVSFLITIFFVIVL
ncbi:succinate dehydrogenase subunit C [Octadecabacter temperatus]|uniref:Succinate dehydrogenase cytochrome b556 subunit n=1 Tax=Octadecabacter temperatus TaxID=1458307 RepID=A0A0K0Y280_9RHOB|nr:succinate dehydrogenase, cytochrome b556 subunit [Octadecabacter temperatus]AKS45043.1 succinate dehydrogenase cytochrome b556 large membrane subunit [Octadecabacter temperatus]SIN85081.1 succinate dehydrogenase subunit C [Octadecabacter temperatus]